MPRLEGYIPRDELPIKQGDRVTIKKGTLVRNVNKGTAPAGRNYKVTIHHFISGSRHSPTMVVWPGSGGYWSECDINDVPEANDA